MLCYTNPYTKVDLYIVLKYIVTIECYPDEHLLILTMAGGHPDLRLHFDTDEEYFATKDYICNHIPRN